MARRKKLWLPEAGSRVKSLARTGDDLQWRVAGRYEIRGDAIRPVWGEDPRHSPYGPLDFPELTRELADYGRLIAGAGQREIRRAVREWAERFGLLNTGHFFRTNPGDDEGILFWGDGPPPEEPINVFRHAALWAREVFDAAANRDWGTVQLLLEPEMNRLTLSLSFEVSGEFDPPELEEAFESVLRMGLDTDEFADAVDEMFDKHDGRIGFTDERVRIHYRVPDLKAAIALHFADLAVGADARVCEECGKNFIVTDRRMKFCSTRCQERSKKRRQRAKR